jgi:flagellar capping protein FliD
LFTDPTSGLATTIGSYISDTLGSSGVLATDEQSLTNQSGDLTTSISTLQTKITNDETEMENEFVTMEDAISSINISKQYLNDYFNSSTSSDQSAPQAATGSTG